MRRWPCCASQTPARVSHSPPSSVTKVKFLRQAKSAVIAMLLCRPVGRTPRKIREPTPRCQHRAWVTLFVVPRGEKYAFRNPIQLLFDISQKAHHHGVDHRHQLPVRIRQKCHGAPPCRAPARRHRVRGSRWFRPSYGRTARNQGCRLPRPRFVARSDDHAGHGAYCRGGGRSSCQWRSGGATTLPSS